MILWKLGLETIEEVIQDHDRNLAGLLQRCGQQQVRLNADKIKFQMHEVPFIGHIATKDGLSVDPCKVQAIVDMPPPKDVSAIQRLLGLTQYLSKFLPHLSDITKPLKELTQKDTAWTWDHMHQQALDDLKKAVTNTPVLRYYTLQEEVTLQCDPSDRSWSSPNAKWPASSLCVTCIDISRNSVCSNRKGAVGHHLCLRSFRSIYIWEKHSTCGD